MKRRIRIVQMLPSLHYGDGIGNDCLAIQDALQKAGYGAAIFAGSVDPRIPHTAADAIRPLADYRDNADILICHIAFRWDYLPKLCRLKGRKIFVWHNITPPRYFEEYGDFEGADSCRKGLAQVREARLTPSLCLTASRYNKAVLQDLGYICPVRIFPHLAVFDEAEEKDCDKALLARYRSDGCVNILFVGRIAPHKKQQDIIAAFYHYHRCINPKSRLFIVGGGDDSSYYCRAIKEYPAALGLDGVVFAGHCTDSEKTAYYQLADVFLCMSEHEGFCVPLVEAMHFKVPVVACGSSAVTETLGSAGLILKRREPQIVAEAIDRAVNDAKLRDSLIANGTERLEDFSEGKVKAVLLDEISRYIRYWQRERTVFLDVDAEQAGGDALREELRQIYEAECGYKAVPCRTAKQGSRLFECETGREVRPGAHDVIYSPSPGKTAACADTSRQEHTARLQKILAERGGPRPAR